jgi:serine/threonine protein kinase
MPLVTSGQFAYVYKLKSRVEQRAFAVRCFRGYLRDRDQRYRAILEHLRSKPKSYLSAFNYEPEGILVGGSRFPILSMNWIEGPTLDLYMEKMIGRREVLLHLADEWVKLVSALHDAGIAHGDLQHGNIIIEHGKLCLVDHDGMFVPAMQGWTSSEVGHQHYQHPRRDATLFDSNLDNFSALVVYLTLLSLAERPSLWAEYHDENLIFSKTDFLDPASSTLFSAIKEIGPEQRRIAETLEQAALGEASAVPYLRDLVALRSALPSWMTAPPELDTPIKTREVALREPAGRDDRWARWQPKKSVWSVPATPPSSTVQTLFGPPAPTLASSLNPDEVLKNTIKFARELPGRVSFWWYWGVFWILKTAGIDFFVTLMLILFVAIAACFVYGFIHAQQLARSASQHIPGTPLPPAQPTAVMRKTPALVSIIVSEPIIGNVSLSIFHRQDCDWVKQISPRNLISFSSAAAAASAGFKACQVCLPIT